MLMSKNNRYGHAECAVSQSVLHYQMEDSQAANTPHLSQDYSISGYAREFAIAIMSKTGYPALL